jgi:hypothetical protein
MRQRTAIIGGRASRGARRYACRGLMTCRTSPLLCAGGRPVLADDATILIIDWHARHGQPRNASAGADLAHATYADPRYRDT